MRGAFQVPISREKSVGPSRSRDLSALALASGVVRGCRAGGDDLRLCTPTLRFAAKPLYCLPAMGWVLRRGGAWPHRGVGSGATHEKPHDPKVVGVQGTSDLPGQIGALKRRPLRFHFSNPA